MICFFDTNVLVYCMDAGDPDRQARAIERFARACEQDTVVLSAQVLQEFYAVTTKKLLPPLSPAAAQAQVERLASFEVVGSSAMRPRSVQTSCSSSHTVSSSRATSSWANE